MICMYTISKLREKFLKLEDVKMTEDFLTTAEMHVTLCENNQALQSHSISNYTTYVDPVKCGQWEQHQNNCNPMPQKRAHPIKNMGTVLWTMLQYMPTVSLRMQSARHVAVLATGRPSVLVKPHKRRQGKRLKRKKKTDCIDTGDYYAITTDEVDVCDIMMTHNIENPKEIHVHTTP